MIKNKGQTQYKYFDSQDPDEDIILVVRKHYLVLSSPFAVGFLMIISIIALYFMVNYQGFLTNRSAELGAILTIFTGIIYTILFSFKGWLIKYLDILVLTTKHLVVIRQDGLFRRGVSVLDLSTIQDVAIRQHGVIQTIFGFGKIDVQTAGEAPNFTYSGVGNPGSIQDAIMDAKGEFTKKSHKS